MRNKSPNLSKINFETNLTTAAIYRLKFKKKDTTKSKTLYCTFAV